MPGPQVVPPSSQQPVPQPKRKPVEKFSDGSVHVSIWENDGPYPGDVCASTTHPGHKGLDDSQWRQMEIQKELYHWLNARGVYINAPDWYFLDGTNKIGIGGLRFYVMGTNLWTKTYDKNLTIDPEQGTASASNLNVFYTKSITFGLNLTF